LHITQDYCLEVVARNLSNKCHYNLEAALKDGAPIYGVVDFLEKIALKIIFTFSKRLLDFINHKTNPVRSAHTYGSLLLAKFMDGVGHYLIDTPLSSDQIVDHLDLQTITISATVEETAKLHWWLTQFGPQVEVLEPKELRTLIAKRHRMAFEQYKD
jgi:hypothetical protein